MRSKAEWGPCRVLNAREVYSCVVFDPLTCRDQGYRDGPRYSVTCPLWGMRPLTLVFSNLGCLSPYFRLNWNKLKPTTRWGFPIQSVPKENCTIPTRNDEYLHPLRFPSLDLTFNATRMTLVLAILTTNLGSLAYRSARVNVAVSTLPSRHQLYTHQHTRPQQSACQ